MVVGEKEFWKRFVDVKCRFGCEGPVGIYHIPKGCICWSDPVQALCAQHAETAESGGEIVMLIGEWPFPSRG